MLMPSLKAQIPKGQGWECNVCVSYYLGYCVVALVEEAWSQAVGMSLIKIQRSSVLMFSGERALRVMVFSCQWDLEALPLVSHSLCEGNNHDKRLPSEHLWAWRIRPSQHL